MVDALAGVRVKTVCAGAVRGGDEVGVTRATPA
jgi:hypothetical protein